MGRKNSSVQMTTLNKDLVRAISAICMDRPDSFWRKYLASPLTRYRFNQAFDGGEINEVTASLIEDAYQTAIKDIIRDCDPVTDWTKYLTEDFEFKNRFFHCSESVDSNDL